MKKYIKLKTVALFLITSIGFSSCSDSFLDSTSSDIVTPDEMGNADMNTAAKSFLSGAYVSLFNPDAQASHDDFGLRAIQLATDFMSDDIAFPNPGFFQYDYKEENNALNYRRPNSTWTQHYAIIAAMNNVLTVMKDLDINEATDAQKQILGQAYGLRGYMYFVLINMFQQPYSVNKEAPGIPIYTLELTLEGRNTVSEVYDVIVSDLEKSYSLLKGYGFTKASELNEYSVAGMLARVYSFINDRPNQWQDVVNYSMIAAQSRPLIETKEQITNGFNTLDAIPEALWGSSINSETNTFYASFFSVMDPYSMGYGSMYYVEIANALYNQIDDNDIRKNWFLAEDQDFDGVTIPKYTQVKFIDRGSFTSDYLYMRSAEFYYLAAEAYYNMGDEANARVALETVMKKRINGYSATSKTGSALLDEIKIQKRIELWGEGVRLLDMKRRGEALNRTASTNHLSIVVKELPANPIPWVYQIPNKEMDANENITENNPV